jgi:hypothetical protein
MNKRWMPIMAVSLVVGLSAGVALTFSETRSEHRADNPTPQVVEMIRQPIEFSYISLTFGQMIEEADLVVVGKVTQISATQWNQDNGEAWEDGPSQSAGPDDTTPLQIHYIDLETEQKILDMLDSPSPLRVTALGLSPAVGESAHGLKVGDEGVFFIKKTDLAWRDGKRSVMVLVGDPSQSYLRKLENGYYRGTLAQTPLTIDQIVKTILQRRELMVQP